jgi:hypothetical protein
MGSAGMGFHLAGIKKGKLKKEIKLWMLQEFLLIQPMVGIYSRQDPE